MFADKQFERQTCAIRTERTFVTGYVVEIMYIEKKTRLANFRAQNFRSIMDSDKFNCGSYLMTNVVNLSLKHTTQPIVGEIGLLLVMPAQMTKQFDLL
jgi:hypothetical protein